MKKNIYLLTLFFLYLFTGTLAQTLDERLNTKSDFLFYKNNTLFTSDLNNNLHEIGEYLKVKSTFINDVSSNCFTYITYPKELFGNLFITKDMLFYQGIKSPTNENAWVFLERQNLGQKFNLWYVNFETNEKILLLTNKNEFPYAYKPIAWSADKRSIYLEAFEIDGALDHQGIWLFDLYLKTLKNVPIGSKYMCTPFLSPDEKFLVYTSTSDEERNPIHGIADIVLGFDLTSQKEFTIISGDGIFKRIVGWQKSELEKTDLLKLSSVDSTNIKELTLLKSQSLLPSFKLPWSSGLSSCVTRTILPNPPGSGCTGIMGCSFPTTSHSQFAIDFGTLSLNEYVLAAAQGTVIEANFGTPNLGNGYGWGNQVRIQHSDGSIALYGHMNSIGVHVGDFVSQGCILGKVGTTGLSTGVHLHFEVRDASFATSYTTSFTECGCTPYPSYNCISGNSPQSCTSNFNLNCSNPIQLSCGVPYNGTTIYQGASGNSNVYSNGCTSWNDPGPEVVHQITVGPNSTFTAQLSNLNGVDLDVFILTSCNPSSCVGTVGSSSATYTSVAGGTYYILVDGYHSEYPAGSGYYGNYGTYTLTVSGCTAGCGQPTNDGCNGLFSATPLTFGSSCNPVSSTICGATYSGFTTCSSSIFDQDVFFSFTPSVTNAVITVTGAAGMNPIFQVLSGSCGTVMTQVDCVNNSSGTTETKNITLPGIQQYFIRVWHYGGGMSGTTGNFTICVYQGCTAQSNNSCYSPAILNIGTTCNYTSGDLCGATQSITPSTCTFNTATNAYDVWYQITPSVSGNVTISCQPSVNVDAVLGLYTNACPTPSLINCVDGNLTGGNETVIWNLSGGTPYLVRVYDFLENVGGTTFQICAYSNCSVQASASPTNVTCYGACDGMLSANANGGSGPYSYSWSGGLGTGQTKANVCPGTYTVTATDMNGCTNTANATITQPIQLTVSATFNNPSCSTCCDGSATANPSGGTPSYSYSWSNGSTTQTINNLCNGDYTVTITDANGCSSSAMVIFSVGFNEQQPSTVFTIFPNPTNDFIFIQGNALENKEFEIKLTNELGQEVKKQFIKATNRKIDTKFDIAKLAQGIYFVRISVGKSTSVFKIQKL